MIKIVDFTEELIPAAAALAMENYYEERQMVNSLPETAVLPPLEHLVENGLGVAAVEGDKLLGFLGGYGPWGPVFCTPDVKGVLSPIHAHAAVKQNRVRIYQRMYQAAAEKWIKSGAASHAIVLYAHDITAHEAFFVYGFGMRCINLIRSVTEPRNSADAGYTFLEIPASRQHELRTMRRGLASHLAQSPCFMKSLPEEDANWLRNREKNPPRTFAAEVNGQIAAYIELKEEGENFASSTPGTLNICGAYCLPEFRGEGTTQKLLDYIVAVLKEEGIARLGVDCESFNPTALNFWSKNFAAYTHSVVRRIDENVLIL